MLFNSVEFIFIFLPFSLFFYYILLQKEKVILSKFCLIISSLFFYAWWNPKYLILLVVYVLANYIFSLSILNISFNLRKYVLALSILMNISLLCYFKYMVFIISAFNDIFFLNFTLPDIILPLAISFHTFQMIAYQLDVHMNKTTKCSIFDFFLFVTFFPQLIAGPIVLHNEILSQFEKKLSLSRIPKFLSIGLILFIIGLVKKVILADTLALYATPVFNAANIGVTLSFFEAWAGVLGYTFQLYFDFSGYADMALGAAYMFGIKLPINFNSPYKATSIIDFWRRWHITLSRFLKNYIYIPLGGGRVSLIKKYRNLLLTMLIGGIWHGAGWTFIIWGLLHGFFLIVNHFWRYLCEQIKINALKNKTIKIIVYWPLTFTSICIAWTFFRSENIQCAINILESMFGLNGISLPQKFSSQLNKLIEYNFLFNGMFPNGIAEFNKEINWLILCFIVTTTFPNSITLLRYFRPSLQEKTILISGNNPVRYFTPSTTIAFLTAITLWIAVVSINSYSEFLYFQF